MKTKSFTILMVFVILLSSCQPATPLPPITAKIATEFTLAPGQIATITDTDLTVRLIGVGGDQRCPSGIECAISGPVSISLSVQAGNENPVDIHLQTFTDNKGLAPNMHFEGIENSAPFQGYLIQVTGVLPYPTSPSKAIKDSDYRVSLTVSKQ